MTDQTRNLNHIAGLIDNWRTARGKEAEWRQAKEELAAVITQHLDGAETGTIDGVPTISLKTVKETRLNQKLLRSMHPDVFAECCETSEKSTGLRIID